MEALKSCTMDQMLPAVRSAILEVHQSFTQAQRETGPTLDAACMDEAMIEICNRFRCLLCSVVDVMAHFGG